MVDTHSLLPVQYSLCLLGAIKGLESEDGRAVVAVGLWCHTKHVDVEQFIGEYAHHSQILFRGLRRQSLDEDGMVNSGLAGSDGVRRIPLEGRRE